MTKYSVEIKLAAVRAYLDGAESYEDIAERYQVSRTPLQEWVAKYQEHGINAFQKGYTNYSFEKEATEEALRAENKRLQMENAYLKKLNALIHDREKLANKTKPK
ncbi:Transposase and inactivated derivatives [Thermoactinomyces sp. DSM 45892]|nr:Transposase and inactivated derivatives [Thermoactinomyces sp. DSM 45892]